MMKKILTAALVLMMAVLAACGAFAEGVTGDWYADVYGMAVKMTVNEDGTYALEMGGDVSNGVWVLEENSLIMDKGTDNEGVFAYDASAQMLNMADEMIFTRDVIEQWIPAAVSEQAALEDFAGIWTAKHVDAFGALLSVDAAGVYLDAAIEGANVSLTMTFMDAETFAGEAVLEGNALVLNLPAKDEFSADMTFAANALEDGSICIATELFSSPAVFYLEKAE